ncbi:MAG: metalloregulator ArsR/SmtB family transcription factor [Acidobacteriota bacterium]
MQNFEIFEIQSEFCRAIANPKRLRILNEIEKKKITVGDIARVLNLSVSNISQHLRILKDAEIVKSEKAGQNVYYSITDKRIIDICQLMREIISDLYEKRMDIFNEKSNY